ncbi:hypothetical protein [Thalassospira mesophila]|uniref:Uncharacterized protein n=1 Tax=Thalassospira mesophila TaxID=1293891 RepID=A0A1Y2L2Y7_9PROT|nr:hypothetical protein [Thalassospira mesophila]OSQ39574.1 hypothetical protein TMES_06065 [Thalassospira mesophila]
MTAILAIYGREDILNYVHGKIETDADKHEIEQLVQSDPLAAKTIIDIEKGHENDTNKIDFLQYHRVQRLKKLAKSVGLLH